MIDLILLVLLVPHCRLLPWADRHSCCVVVVAAPVSTAVHHCRRFLGNPNRATPSVPLDIRSDHGLLAGMLCYLRVSAQLYAADDRGRLRMRRLRSLCHVSDRGKGRCAKVNTYIYIYIYVCLGRG